MPAEELSRYRIFRGHFQGYLGDFLRRPLLLLTLLRDPIERTISCYSYARCNPDYPFHEYARKLTLREYCLHPATRWRIEDYQTSCLLSILWRSGDRLAQDCRYFAGTDYALHRAIEATTAQAVPAETKFGLARGALHHFAAVGLTERIEDSLALFSDALGVGRCPFNYWENASRQRPRAAELDSQTLATIEELTQADRLIYEYVKARMDCDRSGDLPSRHADILLPNLLT
jgi:hypothetical protein